MIKLKNKHILDDLNTNSISRLDKRLNILEYANFRRMAHIDNYRYDNKGNIRTNVLGPGFIERLFLEQAFYLEQMFLEQMFEGNVAAPLVGIMTVCKNLFLQELFLRFMGCKSKNNLFLFFDGVQGQNKLTLDNGIIIVYNVGNNQSRRLK